MLSSQANEVCAGAAGHKACYCRGLMRISHAHVQVHLDVKPENFCLRLPGQGHSRDGPLSLCLIDLGSCQKCPSPEQEGSYCRFFGTTDYAGSTAMQRIHPGPGDDLESLAYTSVLVLSHFHAGC